ncbi:MAG: hypothetical protein WBK55_08310 [Alphaproteobacteria bacterium]
MIAIIKNVQAKKIIHETVAQGYEDLCDDVNKLACELAEKFSNGAGDILKQRLGIDK